MKCTIKLVGMLVLLLALAACSTTVPNRQPIGEQFPTVNGTGLDGTAWNLPADLAGEPAVILVGYEQRSQFDIDRWLLGLAQADLDVKVLEVPTIDSTVAGWFADSIDEGMRGGIPDADEPSVVTVYDEADRIVELTGNENPYPARVLLLDRDGKVAFFHDEGYSPRVLLEMQGVLAALASEPGSTAARE